MTIVYPPTGESKENYLLRITSQMLRVFRGRVDHIGVANGADFHPEELATPLSPERLATEHLGGQRCLGLYLMTTANTVAASCLDFDNKPHRPDPLWQDKTDKVVQLLVDHGLAPLVEVSQSGLAAHVWLFFDQPVPARDVRVFWRGLLATLDVAIPEIYPRQDVLKEGGLGNLIRFPLWSQSQFVDVTGGWRALPPIKTMSAVSLLMLNDLERVAAEIGFSLNPSSQSNNVDSSENSACELPHRVQQLLAMDQRLAARWRGDTTGLKDTSRSALLMSIATMMVFRYLPTDEIETAIRAWCAAQGYAKGDREDWIASILDGAYDLAAASWRQRRGRIIRYLPHNTPAVIQTAFSRAVTRKASH